MNLRPLATAPAALGTSTLLHVLHQPSHLTFLELIVPSFGHRQPEPSKPFGVANVVQEVGQFGPKVLENRMLQTKAQSLSVESGVPIVLPRAAKQLYLPEALQPPCKE